MIVFTYIALVFALRFAESVHVSVAEVELNDSRPGDDPEDEDEEGEQVTVRLMSSSGSGAFGWMAADIQVHSITALICHHSSLTLCAPGAPTLSSPPRSWPRYTPLSEESTEEKRCFHLCK